MARSLYTNTGTLITFMIRRDRIRLPLWFLGISFFTFMVPLAFQRLYPTQQERDVMAETMHNPAMTAMVGAGNLEHYTIGAMTTHQMLLLTSVVVGLMSIFLVTRHTRADEEDGRMELIRSLPTGRLATIHATLLLLVIVYVILSLLIGFGLFALGIDSMKLEGSLLYGATLGATGIFFVGVTAIFAQLADSSRGTIGYSMAVLLIAYLIRAIGDVSHEALSLTSPFGWVTKTESYSSNHWWPIGLLLGISILLFIFASYLHAIRDLEAGLFPSKSGRRHASRWLQSPIGLACRLQRVGIISWAIGMLLLGLSYGSVFGDLESFFEGNEMIQQLLADKEGNTLIEQFLPLLMVVIAIIATIPPLLAMVKLIGEEKKNRLEHLLSRAVSRNTLIKSYLMLAFVQGFVMISLAAFGLWAAANTAMDDGMAFTTIYKAALVYYPAMLVMVGLAAVIIGWVPKGTSFMWGYLLYSFLVVYLGGLFQFPEWMGKWTPYGYIPPFPVEEIEWLPLVSLCMVAVGFMGFGMIGYHRRDMMT